MRISQGEEVFIGAGSIGRVKYSMVIGAVDTQDCPKCFKVKGIQLTDLRRCVNLGFRTIQENS